LLAAIAIGACAAWVILAGPSDADDQSANPAGKASPVTPAAPTEAALVTPPQATAPAATTALTEVTPIEKAPIDGLKISSQYWHRGGLGSKALVTLTLRNSNEYAVKDIEIACSFVRRDGSHLTDRKRVISDTIDMKSRKTYASMLIGFVNINANKAKCSLVTASRA
jgi:hypothetical protein